MSGNPLVQSMNNANFMAGIQNSPIMKIAQMMESGGNPQALFQQMMGGNNPQMQQIMSMMNGKSPEQLGNEIKDMANQKGIDIRQLTQAIGVPESALKSMGLM